MDSMVRARDLSCRLTSRINKGASAAIPRVETIRGKSLGLHPSLRVSEHDEADHGQNRHPHKHVSSLNKQLDVVESYPFEGICPANVHVQQVA